MGSGNFAALFSYGRIVKMAWLTLLAAAGLALAAPVMAIADSAQFNIEAQPLPQALKAFAAQAHMQLLYEYGAVAHAKGNAVVGDLEKHTALQQLLKNSGLEVVYSSDDSATIRRVGSPSAKPQSQATDQNQDSQPGSRLQLAQATVGEVAGPSAVEPQQKQSETSGGALQEIIVTAEKKAERLLDVPVPVTAISADKLVDNNELRLQDYFQKVPGLNVTTQYNGTPTVAIRGLKSGLYTNPTVGIVIDDIPFGASTAGGGGDFVSNIDPDDLERIEVLRGPQGTLYGANSMGGLIKYVTADPSTDGVSGHVRAGVTDIRNAADPGYLFSAAVNVPLSDAIAVRGGAFTRRDPGYIDDVEDGDNGVNRLDVYGGRVGLLWRLSSVFSLRLSALFQDSHLYGSYDVTQGLGDLQQNTLADTGLRDSKIEAYSANMTAQLGGVTLTALTGYSINTNDGSVDLTPAFGALNRILFGVTGTPLIDHLVSAAKFTQEIRLTGSAGSRIDWLFGGFYNHESTHYDQDILAADPSGAIAGLDQEARGDPSTYAEVAAFGDLTFHVTDRFDLQIGGRESHDKQTAGASVSIGALNTLLYHAFTLSNPEMLLTKENAFTYLVTPRFRLSPDFMMYARFASGFRPGGSNGPLFPTFGPDYTNDYELGTKGDFLDHSLTVDVSVYYIDWRDIQVQLLTPTLNAIFENAGQAKSQGVELSSESKLPFGLRVTGWLTWNDAVITSVPATVTAAVASGDRLPYDSRYSGNLALSQEFSLAKTLPAFVGGSLSYVGDFEGDFGSSHAAPQRQYFPGYARVDLNAGVNRNSWKVMIYLNNVTDKRGALNGGIGTSIPERFQYITPRTVGLSMVKTF